MKCCKTCGQTLPPRLKLSIKLAPGAQRIVDRVHRAGSNGILSTELFEFVYGDDPNGGPNEGRKALAARIWAVNKKLKKDKIRIRAPVGGSREPTAYVLEKIT